MISPFLVAALIAGQAPQPVKVPFALLQSRHMTVEATVNGQGPYRFVFDTGAPINLIGNDVAKAAGLSRAGFGGFGALFGTPQQEKADRVAVGGATVEKMPVMVMDHPTVAAISDAAKADGGPLRGIIGYPFFARYALTIDYQAKELTLTPNGYVPGDYLQDMIGRLNALAAGGAAPKVVAPAGLWGLTADKPDDAAGVVLAAVSAGGPADKAGLRVGDRLLTVDGRWTDSVADLALAASFVPPGQAAEVAFVRSGVDKKVIVKPANGL